MVRGLRVVLWLKVDASRGRNDPRKASYRTLSMARFRSKSCLASIKVVDAGAGEVCEFIVGEPRAAGDAHGHRRRQVWGQRPGQHSQPLMKSRTTGRVNDDMSVFQKILKAGEGKRVRQLAELVGPINELSGQMAALTDAELRAKTDVFRERLAEGETLDDLLIEAFAVVREGATRVLGQRHYDVQLMGGMALHFGWIAEMKTGEGKTLVSTLPVYLNALAGNGVHVVTVNDYLATRDANWMGQLHRFLGLSVGRVGPDLPDFDDKRDAYACDVTYGTNTEFGFDYLRDNMARRREHMVQRGHPLRHRRRGRLDPHRRGPHTAHHLGSRVGRHQALLPVRLHRALAHARHRLRGRRGEEDGRSHRGGHREGGEAHSG